jgi:tRNA dimethylallyltransferase
MTGVFHSNAPLFLVGATGTGKSAAALELAQVLGGSERVAILAMDAMQVYRGADIGTGKPTAAERATVPHGGLDLVDFGESFDVAQYLKHAQAFLREHHQNGRRVLIVGGTGLYFRALTRGLCEAPRGSDPLRAELGALSVGQLRDRLGKVDPEMLKRIDTSNPRRLVRAIEVIETTGRSLRDWQEMTLAPAIGDYKAIWIQREKAELSQRIEERVEAMFAQGWVEEILELQRDHTRDAVVRFPGIGYREIAESLAARVGGEYRVTQTLKSNISVATRQYAKRQLTWFAREPNLQIVSLTGHPSLSATLRAAVSALL